MTEWSSTRKRQQSTHPTPFSGSYYKSFTIVIYDRNDSDLYNNATIVKFLALTRNINRIVIYNFKEWYKLMGNLPSYKPFIVQASARNTIHKSFLL